MLSEESKEYWREYIRESKCQLLGMSIGIGICIFLLMLLFWLMKIVPR